MINGCSPLEPLGVTIGNSAEKCVCSSKSGVACSIEGFALGDFVFFAGVALGTAIGFQDVGGGASASVVGVGETSDRADLKILENIERTRGRR